MHVGWDGNRMCTGWVGVGLSDIVALVQASGWMQVVDVTRLGGSKSKGLNWMGAGGGIVEVGVDVGCFFSDEVVAQSGMGAGGGYDLVG